MNGPGTSSVLELRLLATVIVAMLTTGLTTPRDASAATPAKKSSKPATAALPFAVGESLSYDGSWQGMDAASAELTLTAGTAPATFRVTSNARTGALVSSFFDARFDSDIVCDAVTLLPLKIRRVSSERGKARTEEAVFDRKKGVVIVDGERRPMAPDAHDPVTALYALRTLRFGRLGSVKRIPLTDLGTPLTLDIEVIDRKEGLVSLRLVATEVNAPRTRSEIRVEMEEGGRRRLVKLVTTLPFGEVTLDLRR